MLNDNQRKGAPKQLLLDSGSMLIPKSPNLAQIVEDMPPSPTNNAAITLSSPKHNAFEALTLNDLLAKPVDNVEQIEELLSYLKSLKTPYSALFPLKRVKGSLMKVHRLKLSSY